MPKPSRSALVTGFAVVVAAAILAVTIGSDPSASQASIPTDTLTGSQTSVDPVSPGTGRPTVTDGADSTTGPGSGTTTSSPTGTTTTIGTTTSTRPLTTTTTAIGATTTSQTPVATETVGYIGCSNTADTVKGYFEVGGKDFWPKEPGYGGGTAVNWSSSDSYWQIFDAHLAAQPTTTFWWQLCARAQETDTEIYNASLSVLATLLSKVPGAKVYLSALNGWVDPHICEQVGPGGEERIDAQVARLLSEGRASAGPVLPDLFSDGSAGNGVIETRADGCHPNSAGETKLGAPLLTFFG